MVRMAAYFRAQQRGFAPGNEWEDWLAAEAEIGALVGPARRGQAAQGPCPEDSRRPEPARGERCRAQSGGRAVPSGNSVSS